MNPQFGLSAGRYANAPPAGRSSLAGIMELMRGLPLSLGMRVSDNVEDRRGQVMTDADRVASDLEGMLNSALVHRQGRYGPGRFAMPHLIPFPTVNEFFAAPDLPKFQDRLGGY